MLNEIVKYTSSEFSQNSHYLWIWNPGNVPPHMGLSVDGRYFSLKANGVDLNIDVEGIIEIILRKGIPVVAIELNLKFTLAECIDTFGNFTQTIPHEVTCLNPIKTVLNQNAPMKLAELLTKLDSLHAIWRKVAWNIEDTHIELPEYSVEDIHTHLVALSK